MRIWDTVKKAWGEVKAEIDPLHFDIETGGTIVQHPVDENPDDFEIRHQPVYDHVTGIDSMQPVRVRKGDVKLTS
jgi:hypothetical protein